MEDVRSVKIVRGGDVESVGKEWEKFKNIMKEFTNDVCGVRLVGR